MKISTIAGTLALLSVITILGWISYFAGKPTGAAAFATVEGTLQRVEERANRTHTVVDFDIFLNERPGLRFTLSNGREYFQREEFLARVHPGTKLKVQVRAAQLIKPAVVESQDTVYVCALSDNARSYLAAEDYQKWELENHRMMLYIAVLPLTAATVITGAVLGFALVRQAQAGAKPRRKKRRL
jgi:hypothetical protein